MFHSVLRTKLARFVATPVLIFWISGGGCIFGCEAASAVSRDQSSLANNAKQDSESCAAHRSHDCCVKKNKPAHSVHSEPGTAGHHALVIFGAGHTADPESCPMAINANAAVSKNRSVETALTNDQFFLEIIQPKDLRVKLSTNFSVINRGTTHLRCCVFLI